MSSISISGSNSISGLGGNDTDFDKVLSQLKQIESIQLNRLEAWKSDWKLRYDAFTQIIDQVQAASSMLSQLSDKNNFVTKQVQSSNSNVVTAVANAAAQDVQHTIKISQVANNAIWANTGHVFETKNDVINDTGEEQFFSYTYAGERHDFSVPPNTSLDSFASMINNSADNPGIKVSLIQMGSGYVFQVSGKETGAAHDLIIHDSKLVGMSSIGSTSRWQTNNALDLDQSITNPTTYIFDLELKDGTKKSVSVKGSATGQELVNSLNRELPNGVSASLDATTGELKLDGVKSVSRREEGAAAYEPASTRFTLNGPVKDEVGNDIRLNDSGGLGIGYADNEWIEFTITMDDDSTRSVQVRPDATKSELFSALAQATQPDGTGKVNPSSGNWYIDLAGVKDIALVEPVGRDMTANKAAFSTELTYKDDQKRGSMGSSLSSVSAILEFDDGAFIDGKAADGGEDLVFTLVNNDRTSTNIRIKSNATTQDLVQAITDAGYTPITSSDGSGKTTVSIDGVKEFYLAQGDVREPGFSVSYNATTVVPPKFTDDPLFVDDGNGGYLLETPPALEYKIYANDGKEYTLTMPGGVVSMKDLLKELQTPGSTGLGDWTDADGNPAQPANWKITFTDADGNEYVDASGNPLDLNHIEGPVYLNVKDVQGFGGPGIAGQVAESSNWSIQRSTNAKYQVDNWPIEMESETNTVSNVIEGVVFSLQESGEARITVSTDITSVEQSIQNFLDAVNSILLTVNELMKLDENKEVTSNDPNDMGSGNYSPSGLTNQKGGLLMGNYSVQLFKSRFSSLLGANPPGFQTRTSADDILSGDLLASLANLGIKTDTDTTSDTYGLLQLAPSSGIAAMQSLDKDNYNDMITNHLEAVVDFFCASGIGSSSSTDFRYGSHVEGITKGGTYEVKYSVLEDGSITNVTVGGEPAKQDLSQPGNYFSVASGDPKGLAIIIDDLTVGDHPPADGQPLTVRIKEGLVQTTNNFLKSELVFNDVNISVNSTQQQVADAIALKSKNGALMSIRDNYMSVMEGIDAKIEREQRRISTWESRQKAIFANLETLLKQYSQQQSSLEAQLAQLKGS